MSEATTIGPSEPLVATQFEDIEQQNETAVLGMWLFLAQEIMFFGGLFTLYSVYRFKYPDVWLEGAAHTNTWLGAGNTVFLLVSSLTMAMTVYFTQRGRWIPQLSCFAATMVLGTIFLVVKYFEYAEKYTHGLIPVISWNPHIETEMTNPGYLQIYYGLYFIMTGMHALHMIIGIGIASVLMVAMLKKKFGPNRYMPVEIFGFYWHFVDIVWVFLFPLIYLI